MSARRRRSQGEGLGMAAAMLGLVAALVVAVLVVAGMRQRAEEARADAALARSAEASAAAAGDPFEDVPEAPPDDPFGDLDDPAARASRADDPFASLGPPEEVEEPRGPAPTHQPAPGEVTGDETWQDALILAEKAYRKMTEATGATERRDDERAKELHTEALAAFEEAVSSTKVWVRTVDTTFDPRDLQVRSVHSSLARWKRQIEKLRDLY